MPFQASSNPARWQTGVYNCQEAYRDSTQRSWILTFPVLLAILPAGFALIVLLQYERIAALFPTMLSWLLAAIAVVVLAIVLDKLVAGKALRIAGQFLQEFYRLPDELDPQEILRHRLYGVLNMGGDLSFSKKLSSKENEDEKREAARSSPFFSLVGFPCLIVKDGQLDEGKTPWLAWMARNLGGPLCLAIRDGNAVYLERAGRFSRVVGPGEIVCLDWFETIRDIVDTRPYVKEETLRSCWTRDGIQVDVTVRVECCLGNPAQRRAELLYPFDPVAVKAAVERTSVRMPDGKTLTEMKGIDLVWGQVTSVIPDYIGRLKLDELLLSGEASSVLGAEINIEKDGDSRALPGQGRGSLLSAETTQQLREELNRLTQRFGYYVTDVQITRVELPATIEEQRERNWQAGRQRLAHLMRAQAEAARIRAVEEARAEAQRDLILAIAEGLNRDPSRRFAEPLLLALATTITTSLANPLVHPLLTPETLRSLEQLRSLLEGQHGA